MQCPGGTAGALPSAVTNLSGLLTNPNPLCPKMSGADRWTAPKPRPTLTRVSYEEDFEPKALPSRDRLEALAPAKVGRSCTRSPALAKAIGLATDRPLNRAG